MVIFGTLCGKRLLKALKQETFVVIFHVVLTLLAARLLLTWWL